jgi:hypothetical protein
LISLLVNEGQPETPKWTPLTFGDADRLKSLVGHQASVWVTCANSTMYTVGGGAIQKDFLDILQQVFQYPYTFVTPLTSRCISSSVQIIPGQ